MPIRRPAWFYLGLGLAFLIVLWLWTSYNTFVGLEESVRNMWAQVETTYQRRVDLIPNLVSTVSGAADFEKSTITQVTEARTQWLSAGSIPDKVAAAQDLESAIARLLVTVEAYPQLQATQAFRDLMVQLEGTENRISEARRDFNDAVRAYNIAVKTFPRNLIAGFFGFSEEKPFEAAPGSEVAPKVDFGTP